MAKKSQQNEYAVIGLGRFGASLALSLVERGYTVLGVDRDLSVAQGLADDITQTVSLDATDEDALRSVDIQLYSTVVVSIGDDFEDELLTTLALKNIGVKRVVCIASTERERAILSKIGADQIVMPEIDSARRLAMSLVMPSILDHFEIGDASIAEVQAGEALLGTNVGDVDLRAKHGLSLIGIRRNGNLMLAPGADVTFAREDHLLLVGKAADLERFASQT